MKLPFILLITLTSYFSQAGINTCTPKEALDLKDNLLIRSYVKIGTKSVPESDR